MSDRVAATCSAQARAAATTLSALGQTSTDERNDLTGITDRVGALQRTEMFEWRTLRMPVGTPRGDVETVQHPRLLDQERRHLDGRFPQQSGDDVAEGLLPERKMQRLDRFLRSLLCSEA